MSPVVFVTLCIWKDMRPFEISVPSYPQVYTNLLYAYTANNQVICQKYFKLGQNFFKTLIMSLTLARWPYIRPFSHYFLKMSLNTRIEESNSFVN